MRGYLGSRLNEIRLFRTEFDLIGGIKQPKKKEKNKKGRWSPFLGLEQRAEGFCNQPRDRRARKREREIERAAVGRRTAGGVDFALVSASSCYPFRVGALSRREREFVEKSSGGGHG